MPEVMDADRMSRALTRIAHEILERNRGLDELALVGIRTRGVPIARRLARALREINGDDVPTGALDITLYRDDLMRHAVGPQPVVRRTEIPFSIDDRKILLVDDVLYTGRTIRAALDALIDFGRPRAIQLVVLVDRGHRELPIKADYVGKNLPTSLKQSVQVRLQEIDGADEVVDRGGGMTTSRRPNACRRTARDAAPAQRLQVAAPARHRRARRRRDHADPRHRRGDEGDRHPADQESADAARPHRRQPVLRAEHAHAHVVRDRREAPQRRHAVSIATATSSVTKGETLLDTVRNLEAMSPDMIVMRHASSGAPHLLARIVPVGDRSTPATACTSTRRRRCSTRSPSASTRAGSPG